MLREEKMTIYCCLTMIQQRINAVVNSLTLDCVKKSTKQKTLICRFGNCSYTHGMRYSITDERKTQLRIIATAAATAATLLIRCYQMINH